MELLFLFDDAPKDAPTEEPGSPVKLVKSFFNTISLSGDVLKEAIKNAKQQEAAIYLIFSATGNKFTASEVTAITEKAGLKWPIWSNRRAITNLKTAGKIAKLDAMKDGPLGKPEHYYQIPEDIAK